MESFKKRRVMNCFILLSICMLWHASIHSCMHPEQANYLDKGEVRDHLKNIKERVEEIEQNHHIKRNKNTLEELTQLLKVTQKLQKNVIPSSASLENCCAQLHQRIQELLNNS